MLDSEISDLRSAFEGIMDANGEVNLKELYVPMEERECSGPDTVEKRLLHCIWSKIQDYHDLWCDNKVGLDELIGVLPEAMRAG